MDSCCMVLSSSAVRAKDDAFVASGDKDDQGFMRPYGRSDSWML